MAPSPDVIVFGASAGGLDALVGIVSRLPANLATVIGVVVHVPPWRPSILPDMLTRAGELPAVHPTDGDSVEPGHIYVAPPDHHLMFDDGHLNVWRGPKENRHRPAVNALFRSAAVSYGSRVVGVVLSGALEDGATGLWWIKRYGGIAVVQDPKDAKFPGMPQQALETTSVDYCASVGEIPDLLLRLAAEKRDEGVGRSDAHLKD